MGGTSQKGVKGRGAHIYLTKDQEAMLDAIAAAMGQSRIGIEPSRSQLIRKAVSNYIEECREDTVLRRAVEQAEIEFIKEKYPPDSRPTGPRKTRVM
jgi:metal-responsive CopG/Arc/MetJ family transcriptional regulator